MPKGEKILAPKAKGPHHHLILKEFLILIWYLIVFKRGRKVVFKN
jgi:hypothetical protein